MEEISSAENLELSGVRYDELVERTHVSDGSA